MTKIKERVLFLYLSTGGGHLAAAKALAAELHHSSDEVEAHVLNGIPPNTLKLLQILIEKGYQFSTQIIPVLWRIVYQLSTIPLFMRYNSLIMTLSFTPSIRNYIRKHRITRIVNLHSFLISPLFRALGQLQRLDMPVLTVIPDPFTCHPLWCFRQFHSLIVFSKQARKSTEQYLQRYGLPPSQIIRKREIHTFPIILHSKFNHVLSREDSLLLRDRYAFSRHKRLILITGGGEGLRGGENCLKAIAGAGLDLEIAFVCGQNIAQFERIRKIAQRFPTVSIRVYGFVDFMYELMNMADIILTKAGPATIFEALMLRKPLIITQRIYGQEQGNVDFVVNNNLGWFIPRPQAIVQKIHEIIEKPQLFNQIIHNITQKNIANGTSLIIDHFMGL